MNDQIISHQQSTRSTSAHVSMATLRHAIITGWKSLAHEREPLIWSFSPIMHLPFTFQKYIYYMYVHICSGGRQILTSFTRVKVAILLWKNTFNHKYSHFY